MVLHDMNLSARYADYLFAVKDGRIIAEGTPQKIMTEELIQDVFSLPCMIMKDPVSDAPLMIPRGRM